MEVKVYKEGVEVWIKLLKQTGIICGVNIRRNIVSTYEVAYNQNGVAMVVSMSPTEIEVVKTADKVKVIGYKATE
jgi:hypothetical protein